MPAGPAARKSNVERFDARGARIHALYGFMHSIVREAEFTSRLSALPHVIPPDLRLIFTVEGGRR